MLLGEWNKDSYNKFINELKDIAEDKYRDFSRSLTYSKYELLGVRIPTLRKIGKDIYSKTDYKEFFKYCKSKYFEEVMIEGQVISHIKEEEEFYKYFINYIKKIDDWSLCDTFCNSIKIVRKYEDKYFKEAINLSKSKEEFISRTGLIMILNHFIKEENLFEIFSLLNDIKSDKYYINMAEAWLVCELYIYYPQETLKFIKDNKMNKFTHNKSISKIRESFRVRKEEKDYLNTLKK